jgi:hypothetical protein
MKRLTIVVALLWPCTAAQAEPAPPVVVAAEEPIATNESGVMAGTTVRDASTPFCYQTQGPDWFVAADALALQRAAGSGTFLGETRTTFGDTVESLTNGDSSALRVGPRIAVRRQMHDGCAVEALYFGLQQWNRSGTIAADPVGLTRLAESPWLQADDIIGGFDDYLSSSYAARLHNVELNRLCEVSHSGEHSVHLLAGLRYFNWQEDLLLEAHDVFTATYEQLNTQARNHLLGAQIGAQSLRKWGPVQWGWEVKAALAANFISTRSSNLASTGAVVGDPANFDLFDHKEQTTGVAGAVDASLFAKYQLTQHLQVRGGYQCLYVAGLALAPGQLAGANHGEDLLLHGPWLGCELSR